MAEVFGQTPKETDTLPLRDLAVMLHGAVRRRRDGWRRSAMIAAKIHNLGGPRGGDFKPKSAAQLYPDLFDGVGDDEWYEKVKRQFENYNPD